MEEKLIRKYVKDNLNIDASKLSYEDVRKLAVFYLRATSLETPMLAKVDAKKLGLII